MNSDVLSVSHSEIRNPKSEIGRAPVAQSDRAAGFEPAGREFNPLRARQTADANGRAITNDQWVMAFSCSLVICHWDLVIETGRL